jgi:hypothetical protein
VYAETRYFVTFDYILLGQVQGRSFDRTIPRPMTRCCLLALLALLLACEKPGSDAPPAPREAAPAGEAAPAVSAQAAPGLCAEQPPEATGCADALAPEQPVDARFEGCAKSCGGSEAGAGRAVVLQPRATPGDYTHCLVSGALFEITGASPRRTQPANLGARTLYFCCEDCAKYFSDNSEQVLTRRGLSSS